MTFDDLNTFDGISTVFPVCNEDLGAWREALAPIEVDKGAAICSGGEVSFFAILPNIKEKLELFDHSYASMHFAVGKYGVIEKEGAHKARELFTTRYGAPELPTLFNEANKGLPTEGKATAYNWTTCRSLLGGIWNDISIADIEAFNASKHKLHFLHCDISDLVDRGPYDFLYLSNALEYRGRNGTDFRLREIVKPGGYIAYAHYETGVPNPILKEWEIVAKAQQKGRYGLFWTHLVAQNPEKGA